MVEKPISHTGRRSTKVISLARSTLLSGAVDAPRRWSTDDTALHRAAMTARKTPIDLFLPGSGRSGPPALLRLDGRDLGQARHVTPTLERGGDEEIENSQSQLHTEHPGAQCQHIGVVVLARQPGGELVVTERCPHTMDLVGRDLLALAAASDHHTEAGVAPGDSPRRGGAGGGGAERRRGGR